MRKYFLSFVALAAGLFATSCQESIVEPQVGGPTTFTVQLPDQMGTKAFGEAGIVTELLVEVYPQNGESVIYQTVEQGTGQFEVSLNLIQDQAYDILFWAQTEDGYVDVTETNGKYSFGSLRNVPMNSNYLNNDNGAAFFHAEKGFVPNGTSTTITLVRPFAQLNLGTTTASLITDAGVYELVSSAITVTGMANSFNVFSGEGFGDAVATYNFTSQDVPDESLSAANATYEYVSMNYLSVLGNEKALVNIDATIVVKKENEEKTINHSFTSVPVQENYRTNIVGNLISSTTDFNVVVDTAFAKDANGNLLPDNDYLVVDNVAAANTELGHGADHIAINMIESVTSVLNLDNSSKETLYIQLPDADATLKIEGTTVKNLYISVPNTTSGNPGYDLTIYTPNAHVELNGYGNSFRKVVATTSSNTLVLSGVVVEEVVVEQGNVVVENESTVGEIEPGDNVNPDEITIYVDDASTVTDVNDDFENVIQEEEEGDIKFITSVAKLQQLAGLVNAGTHFKGQTITLLADIDLNNVEWTPIGNSSNPFKGTFDGNNHTISNLVVEGGSSSNQGLFGFTTDGEIKNLIVNNAKVSGRLNVGVVAGTPYTSKYTNIKVTGHVEVKGMAYVGGVAGKNAYANWKDIKVEVDETSFVYANSVEDGTAYRTYVGGVVGFNGEGGHSFTNITSNIDVKGSTCDVGGLFGIAHYGNNFVNCSSSGDVEIYAADDIDSAEEIGGIAGVWHNQTGTTVTFTNCSFTGNLRTNVANVDLTDNLIVGAAYSSTGNGKLIIDDDVIRTVSKADELVAALEANENVLFLNDIKIDPASMSNAYGTTGINVKNGQVINGDGHTLNIKGAGGTWDSGINTTGGLIKNITVTGSFRGIFINHNSDHSEKVVLENVTLEGVTYTISCDQGTNNGLEAYNSTFNGWTSYAATLGDAKFTNCSFGEGNTYKYCRPYAPTEFVGCDFEEGYKIDPRAKVTFENCTIGGVSLTADNLSTLVTNTSNASVK